MTDKRQLTVAIAAGGTAGHVNPALALADELRDRGHEVHFFGESRRLEGTLVPKEGFPFHPVHVTGFDRRRPWTLVTALMHLSHEEHRLIEAFGSGELPMPDVVPFHPVHVTGFDRRRPWTLVTALMHLSHEEHRLIEAFGSGELPMPDVAIGFGAYLELPLMRAAAKLGIPIALHEQNSVPGLAKFGSGELPMPDVAIGFGAYLELPLMRAAAKLGIPIALHEQNSVPGLANKRTAKSARLIALGQPAAEDVMRSCAGRSSEVVFTGNPVRRVSRTSARPSPRVS